MSFLPIKQVMVALIGAAAVLFAGCGSDGHEIHPLKPEIEPAVKRIVLHQDPDQVCAELITEKLMNRVYGGGRECWQARMYQLEMHDDEMYDGPVIPDDVQITGVTENENALAVRIIEEGGPSPGAEGTLHFVKENGSWKLARYGPDYARSKAEKSFDFFIETVFGQDHTEENGALQKYRECIQTKVSEAEDAFLLDMFFDEINSRNAADRQNDKLNTLAARCASELSAVVGAVD